MYQAITKDVSISVESFFLPEQSVPERGIYVWAYQVEIENRSEYSVQVLGRKWQIVDSHGTTHAVDGEGIVGEQPRLRPGETYSYISGVPLQTPSGIMSGQYSMRSAVGEMFDADIPAFSLDSPYRTQTLH